MSHSELAANLELLFVSGGSETVSNVLMTNSKFGIEQRSKHTHTFMCVYIYICVNRSSLNLRYPDLQYFDRVLPHLAHLLARSLEEIRLFLLVLGFQTHLTTWHL